MSLTDTLQKEADNLREKNDITTYDDKIKQITELFDGDGYSVAKIWKTTPVAQDGKLAGKNLMDLMTLVHTSISERDLAETFYEDLTSISQSTIINKAVKVEMDGDKFHIVPTKFAQQGTIGLGEEGYPTFASIVGHGDLLAQASVLIQQWQHLAGLDQESQQLLPFEIELVLTHLIKEQEPASLEELLHQFFDFGREDRFANQLNIFDKHGNVLMYHDFMIPDKQHFLEALFDAESRFNSDNPDLTLFGIN